MSSLRHLTALPALLLALALGLAPDRAAAWWSADFKQRTKFTLNTGAAGVETREALAGVTVPLRLHSGNFDFVGARQDGADLRVVAGDDKTPLRFYVERFDSANELAVVWVQLPSVAPGSATNTVFVYAGNEKAAADPASTSAAVFDGSTVAAIHFADAANEAVDHTGTLKAEAAVTAERNGLIGPAARLAGSAIRWTATERVRAAPGAPYTVALWVRPESAAGTLLAQGALSMALEGGRVAVRLGTLALAGGNLPTNAWAHVALSLGGGKATLYVNGAQAAQGDLPAPAPAIEGALAVGQGLSGLVDEVQVSSAARSAEWLRFTHAAQSADAKLVAAVTETPGSVEGGGGEQQGYMGILVKNLTIDAWVVIVILAIMFVIAVWVMVVKALLVSRIDRGNRGFLEQFRGNREVLAATGVDAHPHSSLARLYDAGRREVRKRDDGRGAVVLSGASLDAVKAAVDADVVRETNRLNSQMVLLTIAISGGPFLGLLGTVVGVMITFAAIAAAGDVNVNAIAPGIAAALLATVAGLAVAIPALFGYNYLASRIKNISADMQIFVDEFVTRVAEAYGAR